MARRLIGTGTTDNNGKITVSYTGTGAGKIQLVAVNGNLLSETYELMDAKWIYAGTSYMSSTGTVTSNSDGSYTLGTDGTNYAIFTASTSSSNTDAVYADIGECFEFDLVSYTGGITLRANTDGGINNDVNNIWTDNTHYKVEVVDNGVKFNGTLIPFSDTGARRFILRVSNEATVTIKNLVYY